MKARQKLAPHRLPSRRGTTMVAIVLLTLAGACSDTPTELEPDAEAGPTYKRQPRGADQTPAPPPANGTTTRLTLSPTDTLRSVPVGATKTVLARAWAGTQEVATPVKWWIRDNGIATLNSTLCTTPCSVPLTAKAVGSTLLDIHEHVRGSSATRDQLVVEVTQDASVPPPDSSETPVSEATALVVMPASVTLAAGATHQFAATGKLSDGSSVPVTVTWTATGGTIDANGLYRAGTTAGSHQIIAKKLTGTLADTGAVTIAPTAPTLPPSPVGATCFDNGSPTRAVSSTFAVNQTYDQRSSVPAGSRIDASAARWSKSARTGDYMVRVGSGRSICWHGGRITGLWNQSTEPWETYHSSNGFTGDGPDIIFENIRVENYGDGMKWMGNATNWTLRRAHFIDIHDDCVETDWMEGGRIEDVLFEGCFTFVATRPRKSVLGTVDGRNDTLYIDRAIVWHKSFPTHGAGRFWKIDTYHTPPWGPWHVITNSIVRMDPGQSSSRYCLNEGGIVKRAENNVIVWTGNGEFPCAIPPGWTLTRDVGVYERAVSDWKAKHPGL